MSRLMLTGTLWFRCRWEHLRCRRRLVGSSYIVDRSSQPHHLDHLDAVSWIISTLLPGSSQRHHTSSALPKLQCWVEDWLHVPRSRLISYSLSRLAPSVLIFPLFSFPTTTTNTCIPNLALATLVFRSCEGSSYPLPSSGSSQSPHRHSSNAVVLDPLPAPVYSYFLPPGYCIK